MAAPRSIARPRACSSLALPVSPWQARKPRPTPREPPRLAGHRRRRRPLRDAFSARGRACSMDIGPQNSALRIVLPSSTSNASRTGGSAMLEAVFPGAWRARCELKTRPEAEAVGAPVSGEPVGRRRPPRGPSSCLCSRQARGNRAASRDCRRVAQFGERHLAARRDRRVACGRGLLGHDLRLERPRRPPRARDRESAAEQPRLVGASGKQIARTSKEGASRLQSPRSIAPRPGNPEMIGPRGARDSPKGRD